MSIDQNDDTAVVVIRLEGKLPGGLVDLHYAFTISPAGRIGAVTFAAQAGTGDA